MGRAPSIRLLVALWMVATALVAFQAKAADKTIEARLAEIARDPTLVVAGNVDVTDRICRFVTESALLRVVERPTAPFNTFPFSAKLNKRPDADVFLFHAPLDRIHSVDMVIQIKDRSCAAYASTVYL